MGSKIEINSLGGHHSEVVIGSVAEHLPLLLEDDRRVILITDANVHLNNRAFVDSYEHIVIGQGESSKTLQTVEAIVRKLLEMNADRSTFLLGMGGGIVTDITGFVASTYMRGMEFGFIATTLLSQVDASVGGKNGVNLDGYKNIIGVFNQPSFVICDPALLRTLPEREFRAGLAEIIKVGIIADPDLFAMFEEHNFEEFRKEPALLEEIITRAVKVKAAIVERDEEEHGERRKLNLGHTFAHAMEKSMPLFSHGEAVAAGIVVVSDAAVKLGRLSEGDAARIMLVIDRMGLPMKYPADMRRLLNAVKFDKKRERESIHIVLPVRIGQCEVVQMSIPEIEELFLEPTPEDATLFDD